MKEAAKPLYHRSIEWTSGYINLLDAFNKLATSEKELKEATGLPWLPLLLNRGGRHVRLLR